MKLLSLVIMVLCVGACTNESVYISPGLLELGHEKCTKNGGLSYMSMTYSTTGRKGTIYYHRFQGAVYCVDGARFSINHKEEPRT